MKLNITLKLLLCGLILVFVPVLIVGGYSIFSFTKTSNAQAANYLEATTTDLAYLVDMALSEERDMVRLLGKDEKYSLLLKKNSKFSENELSRDVLRSLRQICSSDSEKYRMAYLVDRKGKILVAANASGFLEETKGADVSDRDYFQKSQNASDVVISSMILSRLDGASTVVFYYPIRKGDLYLGGFALSVDVSDVTAFITEKNLGKTGYAYAVNKEGTIIVHPNDALVFKTKLFDLEGMENISHRILSESEGIGAYTYKGEPKTASFHKSTVSDWVICATINDHELYEPSIRITKGIFFILLICCFVGGGISHLFAVRLSKPILRVVDGLRVGANEVRISASQVAGSSQILAESSSEQASSLEETSASLEQMSSMSNNSSNNSHKVESLMGDASTGVKEVLVAMKNLSDSMGSIAEASEETQKIVKTIDEIAFQTNILALNAAVEAARAGEAGAGFAVVAEEVRNLASRAASAAHDTSSIIQNTVERVLTGVDILDTTDRSFAKVANNIDEVNDLISEITESGREQMEGISQINRAVSIVDERVQKNAAAAEESAAASEELKEQSVSMEDYIHVLAAIVDGGKTQTSSSIAIEPVNEPLRLYQGHTKKKPRLLAGFLN